GRSEPQRGIPGGRDERAIPPQPARARERPAENRGGRGPDHAHQARRGAPLHRGSAGAAAHGARGTVRGRARDSPADGEADRDSQGDGVRAAQEGGRRHLMTGWLGRRALRTIHEFRARLARYHLQQRKVAKATLAVDPVVEAAVLRHAQEHSLPHTAVRRRVEQYVDEIVPQLNVLSYYKIGYN